MTQQNAARQNAHARVLVDTTGGQLALACDLCDPDGSPVVKVQTTAGIGEFPRADVELRVTKAEPKVVNIRRGDKLTALAGYDKNDLKPILKGEVAAIEILTHAGADTRLSLHVRSPFYRLELVPVDDKLVPPGKGLRETLTTILQKCDVWGQVHVDSDVDDALDVAYFDRFPALALVKLIFLHKDLVYQSLIGDEMVVSNRASAIRRMNQQAAIVMAPSDIISSRLRF